jgi:hypothetical protein
MEKNVDLWRKLLNGGKKSENAVFFHAFNRVFHRLCAKKRKFSTGWIPN